MQQQNEDVKIVRIPHNDENIKVCEVQCLEIDQFENFFEYKCIVLKLDLNYWINYQTVLKLQELQTDKSEYISRQQIIQIFIQLIRNVQLLEKNAIYIQLIQNQDIWIKYQRSNSPECDIIKTIILSQANQTQQYEYLNIIKYKIKENSFFNKQNKTQIQQLYGITQLLCYLQSYSHDNCQNNKPKTLRLFWPSDLLKNQEQLITMLGTELYNQVPDSLLYYSFNNYTINDLILKVNYIQNQIDQMIIKWLKYFYHYEIIQDQVKLGEKQMKNNLSIGYTNYIYQVLKVGCKLNYLELFTKNDIKMVHLSQASAITSMVKYGFKQQSYKYQYYLFCIIMSINKYENMMNKKIIDDLYQKTQDKLNFHFQEFIQQLIKVLQLSQEFEDMIKSLLNNLQFDYVYEQMLDHQITYSDDESIKKIINQYYQTFLKQVIFQKLEEQINKL